MFSIYSLCPAPWGDRYRLVEMFDTEEDAKLIWNALQKVNILFHYYKIVEEHPGETNKVLRAEVRRQIKLLSESAVEICNLKTEIEMLRDEASERRLR